MHNLSSAEVTFANTKEAKWLAENAHRFGFILRYPEDKVAVTGYSYEPWHFRFVGRKAATEI
jgi:LAS superfamily LD-carboxypeptidase LdcB